MCRHRFLAWRLGWIKSFDFPMDWRCTCEVAVSKVRIFLSSFAPYFIIFHTKDESAGARGKQDSTLVDVMPCLQKPA
ncbi:hypothetical protein BDV37DRAFT_232875 [Aspergillus pseudonomiae]|uniref:Uncharacterized protein n=1 Tax=Aspergillus pseudonomiae TaxID=1506151 RepID=A0A5N7CYW6_9EURO|nr:uncharacterized protein BDV37DRAFT_232875 [Aspergillus pseudonomiae]KAE8399376.1 hypothetical protein BDV37DRAFT_232875 [Aspergillus pseudonomiae]